MVALDGIQLKGVPLHNYDIQDPRNVFSSARLEQLQFIVLSKTLFFGQIPF